MPRPDVSNLTVHELAGQLLAMPEGVDCIQLRLTHYGEPVYLFVSRGKSADALHAAIEERQIGRADFDPT